MSSKVSSKAFFREEVHVARPTKTNETAGKSSGGKKSGNPAGSGKSIATDGQPVGEPKRGSGLLPVDLLQNVAGIPAPLASELAGILPLDEISSDELIMPVYGNYCGMGHGDPTGQTPPIDAVDAVCREHDMCYESLGDFEPWCDIELIGSMPDAIARTPSPLGKQAGVLALLYFSVAERNLTLGKTLFKTT
jgi:hypothetical protein